MPATAGSASAPPGNLLGRLDGLYEFERQPVTDDKLQPGAYFAGVYSGEHIAATEFVIGASFVSFGASAYDVLLGLLLGNLLAVLSWTLACAPIAYQTRLTLYWYLRKIAGPAVTVIYNLLNAILHCILAGAMFTVSASAVRVFLKIPPQTGWLPTDWRFVPVVLGVGAVVVTLAILGFKRLAQFAAVCSPWMVVMFVVGALAVLPSLGRVDSLAGFWEVAEAKIWAGPQPGQAHPLGFWHIVAFAWICNLATHLGLSDMALFRFARRPWYGLYSAFGMYLGHYLAWICAGIMGAGAALAIRQPLTELDSGAVAYHALGAVGALCVVLAGWTTANPTLYRAGLALQVVTPNWPRWLVTLVAGAITTIVACSPFVFLRLLQFVALYGILLFPVGAIVIAEHWIFPRLGLAQFWSARKGQLVNWPALVSWLVGLGIAAGAWVSKAAFGQEILHEFFLAIPVWIVTTVLYVVLASLAGAREALPELPAEPAAPRDDAPRDDRAVLPPSASEREHTSGWNPTLYAVTGLAVVASLLLCLASAMSVFLGLTRPPALQAPLIVLSLVYFVSSVLWLRQREKRPTLREAAETGVR